MLSSCPDCNRPFSHQVPPTCPKCGRAFSKDERKDVPTAEYELGDPDYEQSLSTAGRVFRGGGTIANLLMALAWVAGVSGLIAAIVIGDTVASHNGFVAGFGVGLGVAIEVLIFAALLGAIAYGLRLLFGIWQEVWSANYWAEEGEAEA